MAAKVINMGLTYIVQDTAPTPSPHYIWVDSANGNVIYVFYQGAWVSTGAIYK